MSDYSLYCTETQTKKALELGAPIEYASINEIRLERYVSVNNEEYTLPTAEQMIGWLEDMEIIIIFMPTIKDNESDYTWVAHVCHFQDEIVWFDSENLSNLSRKKVTLAAIDAALDYLVNNNLLK